MHYDRRNLVLLGPVDSGKSALTELIGGGGGVEGMIAVEKYILTLH